MIAFAAALFAIATLADQCIPDVVSLRVMSYNLTKLLLGFTAFIGWLAVRLRWAIHPTSSALNIQDEYQKIPTSPSTTGIVIYKKL